MGRLLGVAHDRGLGDLERERVGIEPRVAERVAHLLNEGVPIELAGRYVDGDTDLMAGLAPLGGLAAGLV